jgi:glycosyltransferase involved in cell wall biosynthesis
LYSGRVKISIYGNAAEKTKLEVLQDADLFVLPTYHEGFCVPIIEALASGCRVISYDNSNVPDVSAGFAKLVETGNKAALTQAMSDVIDEIVSDHDNDVYTAYTQKVKEYVSVFHPRKVEARFVTFVNELMDKNLGKKLAVERVNCSL